jgi:hypothetical protein
LNKDQIIASDTVVVNERQNMKKMILAAAMILTVAAAGVQTANAGDRQWATVGKILTGAIVVDAIAHTVVAPAPVCRSYSYSYSTPGYGYCPPPPRRVICASPAPVVVYRPPVCVARVPVYYAPQVSVRMGYGGERQHHHFRHGRR